MHKVRDVMTGAVITATEAEGFRELAARMLDHHVSGLPVVDSAGRLVGILSESDFLRRSEIGTQRRRPGLLS